MAKPRIFISSTFYDLRQIRADLNKFIRDLGYEPVLNENGHIPYGKEQKLEEYCYKEISSIDILVSIVGGRFGSDSSNGKQSISQMEVQTALKQNKQVYIFIEKGVHSEYNTYKTNKNVDIKYYFVDDKRIYEFIEYLDELPNNNNIAYFETTQDITNYLKEQWAGLFQRFLQEQGRVEEMNLLKSIETTANTLNQLVSVISEEKKDKDLAIQDILLSNHPAMEQIRKQLAVGYRVYFTTFEELTEWLSARNFTLLNDKISVFNSEYYIFERQNNNTRYTLKVLKALFDENNKLKAYNKKNWHTKNILLEEEQVPANIDDLPF